MSIYWDYYLLKLILDYFLISQSLSIFLDLISNFPSKQIFLEAECIARQSVCKMLRQIDKNIRLSSISFLVI